MITIQELANKFNITHEALRYHLKRKGAPIGKKIGNMWFYEERDFENWTFPRRRKPISRTSSNDSVGESSAEMGR